MAMVTREKPKKVKAQVVKKITITIAVDEKEDKFINEMAIVLASIARKLNS